MKIQIIKATNESFVGKSFILESLTYDEISKYRLHPTRIDTEKCIIQSEHFTVHYIIIEE